MKTVIEQLKRAGACSPGLEWSRHYTDPSEWRCDLQERPSWYLWVAGQTELLRDEWPEIFDWCAEQSPWTALRYAAARLTHSRLDACAERYPRTALAFAAKLLTPTRVEACENALEY